MCSKVSEYVVLGGDIAGTTSFSTILGIEDKQKSVN